MRFTSFNCNFEVFNSSNNEFSRICEEGVGTDRNHMVGMKVHRLHCLMRFPVGAFSASLSYLLCSRLVRERDILQNVCHVGAGMAWYFHNTN